MMLFKLCKDSKIIMHPEALALCSEFGVLNQQEMLYVILSTDYCSIFSQYPEDERSRRSCYHSFGDYILDIGKRPKIQAAVNAYNSLQYNPKIEQVRKYQQKIDDLLEELITLPSNGKAINDNMAATDKLRKGIRELEQEVLESYQEENSKLVGGGERSFLEKMQANKALYHLVTKKK